LGLEEPAGFNGCAALAKGQGQRFTSNAILKVEDDALLADYTRGEGKAAFREEIGGEVKVSGRKNIFHG